MKQILEISNLAYNAENAKTTFTLTNYYLHDDGQKEVKTQEVRELPGQASEEGAIAYVKGLIAAGWDMEVVVSQTETQLTEGIQNGQTTGPVEETAPVEETVTAPVEETVTAPVEEEVQG